MVNSKDILDSGLPETDDAITISKYVQVKQKIPWYYAPAFISFWVILFFSIVIPVFFYLPDAIKIKDEQNHPGEFIAERAERILVEYERIGEKTVGSYNNEVLTVQLILGEVEKIRAVMHTDLFNLDVSVQEVSGAYFLKKVVNMYQGVQNIVVRFSAKNATSQSYLLINSHFDSKMGSPGSGDDGAMVVIMLEVLRVLATTRQIFEHPIVFLFNGAEENPLQASHGFITQHEYAPKCKALINLDSAGSGNREILFQSGPKHPWVVDYYRKHVKRPLATTVGEELFQSGAIASDTDFRIFRDYGKVPGLDLAHFYNGYVYHTAFDKYDVIKTGTLQTTGTHVLALARAFADAPELEDPSKYADGHVVFYDYLGGFFLYYTEETAMIINTIVAVVNLILVGISLWRMAENSFLSIGPVLRSFGLLFLLHTLGFLLAFGIPLLLAVIYDADDRSMTWFTNKWLVIGIYICPALFGLAAPPVIYLSFDRDDKLSLPYKIQMVLHSHAVLLAVLTIILTFVGIRSTYLLMMTLFFYAISMIINIVSALNGRRFYWAIVVVVCQVLPFLYYGYICFILLSALIPMMGGSDLGFNCDLLIAAFCVLAVVLAFGFLIPMLSAFQKPMWILFSFWIVIFTFCMLSVSHLGFPYRAKTNVERVTVQAVQRVFYEFDGSVSQKDYGLLFQFVDRRKDTVLKSKIDLSNLQNLEDDCEESMMCGMPFFNQRSATARSNMRWSPSDESIEPPGIPTLKLVARTENKETSSVSFDFELSGPPHIGIFLQPIDSSMSIKNWSFIRDMLDNPTEHKPPYFIYFSYGKNPAPLKFSLEIMKSNGNLEGPSIEIGIGGHHISSEHKRNQQIIELRKEVPDFVHITEFPSSYQRFIY